MEGLQAWGCADRLVGYTCFYVRRWDRKKIESCMHASQQEPSGWSGLESSLNEVATSPVDSFCSDFADSHDDA